MNPQWNQPESTSVIGHLRKGIISLSLFIQKKRLLLVEKLLSFFSSVLYVMHCCCVPPNYARKDYLVSLSVKSWNRSRAANNFLAGAGQIVRSNLFLLGHIPFLAGQTSITSYCYKSASSPLHVMFKYETSNFSKHLLYMSIDLNAGKVERMVQQKRVTFQFCAYYYCLSSTSYIRLVMKLMKLTEACNLVDFKCYWKQGSSIPKMRDWTFKIQ